MLVNENNVYAVKNALEVGVSHQEIFPTVYILDPASVCNLSCVMCPNPQMPESNKGYISDHLFFKIIDDISPYAEFLMLYWMGESLLHPNFVNLLKYARRKVAGRIVVSSNFTFVNQDILKALDECCDIVICSLDRWDYKAYEKIRRGAKFHNVVANIEKLLELRQPENRTDVVVKALDINHNSIEYDSFKDYWIGKGAKPLLAWLNDWAGTFPDMRNAASLPIPGDRSSRVHCADLWFKMTLNWKGEILICCFDWKYEHKIGQVEQGSWLREVWNGKTISNLREAHFRGDYGANKLCKECDLWSNTDEHDAYVFWSENSHFIVF